jgi:hypothetical protein
VYGLRLAENGLAAGLVDWVVVARFGGGSPLVHWLAVGVAQDAVYEFEKRRHIPVKYDRELWQNTVRAMKRVAEIREKREYNYIKQRIKATQDKEESLERDKREVERDIELIKIPEAVSKLTKQKVAKVSSAKMDM